jgi:GNAT superfamily N-acetyltransferase
MLIKQATFRRAWHRSLRSLLARLPRPARFALYRRMIDCDPAPDPRLELKVANTQEELEACFRILHDAYVAAGFMKPSPSGMRVTAYHALPTTTTLCAKFDGQVVGTISLIREGVFGFPMQAVFDLSPVRAEEGQIAEISALAVHPDFRKTGGAILFPLMKFMYEYSAKYFDTRHLVIAVNPDRIEMYESLLFFQRLRENTVDHYDFANGAPAVGATLDLARAQEVFRRVYGGKPPRKNLHRYFVDLSLPHIQLPRRRYHLTNDAVLTPEMLDYFFNRKTAVFEELDDRRRALLWSIYDQPEFRPILPMLKEAYVSFAAMRRHQRFSMRCPAEVGLTMGGHEQTLVMTVIELSLAGFQARSKLPLVIGATGRAFVELGTAERSCLQVEVVREHPSQGESFYGFRVSETDDIWRRCVAALETRHVGDDL